MDSEPDFAATNQISANSLNHFGEVPGKAIVAASADRTARVWEIVNGQPLVESLRHDNDKPINYASFSRDGKYVATASDDRTARIWDADTGKPVSEPLKHDQAVTSATFSADGKWLLTVAENSARLWEVATGKPGETLKHDNRVHSALFSPDGKWIVTAAENLSARVWDAENGKPLTETPESKNWKSGIFGLDAATGKQVWKFDLRTIGRP